MAAAHTCNKVAGDRPRQPSNRKWYRLSRVSWAFAKISCVYGYAM